jgi:hypothetical protein
MGVISVCLCVCVCVCVCVFFQLFNQLTDSYQTMNVVPLELTPTNFIEQIASR